MAENPRIEELRRRVENDPASIAFAQLAEEYRRAGDFEQAVRVCRTGLEQHPTYLSARVTLGRALLELEQFDEARAELDQVIRAAPDNLAAIRGLAEIHQRRGELDDAAKTFSPAHATARDDAAARRRPTTIGRSQRSTRSPWSIRCRRSWRPTIRALDELESWLEAILADRTSGRGQLPIASFQLPSAEPLKLRPYESTA